MRVRIGDEWYDAADMAIAIELTHADVHAIMHCIDTQDQTREGGMLYASIPSGAFVSEEEAEAWLRAAG